MRGIWACLKNIVAEGDSLAVVQALKGSIIPTISIQKVTEGISWWLKKFDNWKILHARQSSNIAAHSMAKEAKSILESVIWVEDSPFLLRTILCMMYCQWTFVLVYE